MKKFALSISAAALLMVGCSDATQLEMAQDDVMEAREEVLEEKAEARNEVAGEYNEGREEIGGEVAEANNEIAGEMKEGREEVGDAMEELAEEKADLREQQNELAENDDVIAGERRAAKVVVTDEDAVEEVEVD